jgi:hypothetical protein
MKGKSPGTSKVAPGKRGYFESNVDLTDWEKSNVEIPSQSQVVRMDDTELNKSGNEADDLSSDFNDEEPEWNRGSLYLQLKLRSDTRTADAAYQLPSRLVGRSGQEALQDKPSVEEGDLAGSACALADAIGGEPNRVTPPI